MIAKAIARVRDAQPALFWTGVAVAALIVPSAIAGAFDDRTLNGISVWVKPVKFQASVAVYLLTLAACFLVLPRGADRTRAGRWVVWVPVVTAIFEIAWITLQGARGEASHWNYTSAFTRAMYNAMGAGAMLLSSASLVMGVMIAREKRPGVIAVDPALRLGLVVGLVLTFVLGAGFGAAMGGGTQHWVGGTPSDAGGVPVFGWSRDGGDLRVAHFFGMHAMHFVPAFAWVAGAAMSSARARAATVAFAMAFTLVTVGLFVQAMLGRPFLPA